MTTIHFIHSGKSYLPELNAYDSFLTELGAKVVVHTTPDSLPDQPEVIWWICGLPRPLPKRIWENAFVIHEYASASVGKLAILKDWLKSKLAPKPNYRLFLNPWVRKRLNFKDQIPFEYRDMGVPNAFIKVRTEAGLTTRKYDLIYIGETTRLLNFIPMLKEIGKSGLELAIVGAASSQLQECLNTYENIRFVGKVSQSQVLDYLTAANCGLNLMPVVAPYTQQTSTKVLEYLAVGLPVISNKYDWIRTLSSSAPNKIYFLSSKPRASDIEKLFCDTQSPDLQSEFFCKSWDDVISALLLVEKYIKPKLMEADKCE